MSAIMGTFVSVKTMADGTPRLILDLQCSLADLAAIGCEPGVAFGLARITRPAAANAARAEMIAEDEQDKRRPPGNMCRWFVARCREPQFWAFLSGGDEQSTVKSEAQAKQTVCDMFKIESRRELDDPAHREAVADFCNAWRDYVGFH